MCFCFSTARFVGGSARRLECQPLVKTERQAGLNLKRAIGCLAAALNSFGGMIFKQQITRFGQVPVSLVRLELNLHIYIYIYICIIHTLHYTTLHYATLRYTT